MEWASDNDGRYAASSYLIYGFLQVAGRPDDAGPPLLARALALRGQERGEGRGEGEARPAATRL